MPALSALRVPGRFSFDGSDLGLIRDVRILREGIQTPVDAEEYGGEAVDEVLVRVVYRVAIALRGWNTAARAAVFPNTSGAGSTIVWPGAKEAGWFRAQDAGTLTFTPNEPSHPSITFENAIPKAVEELEVVLASRTEHLTLVEFKAIRTGNLGAVTWGI